MLTRLGALIVLTGTVTVIAQEPSHPWQPYCEALSRYLHAPDASDPPSPRLLDEPLGKLLRTTSAQTWQQAPCDKFAAFAEFAPRPSIHFIEQLLGFLTTPFGKKLGLSGWTNLRTQGTATGTILRSGSSTDLTLTMDVALKDVAIEDSPCHWSEPDVLRRLCPADDAMRARWLEIPRFLRIEAHGHAYGADGRESKPGTMIQASGTFRVDHDASGFLELHIDSGTALTFTPPPVQSSTRAPRK